MTKKVKILVCCLIGGAVAITCLVTPLAIHASNNNGNSPPGAATNSDGNSSSNNNSNNNPNNSDNPNNPPDTSDIPAENKIQAKHLGGNRWQIDPDDIASGIEKITSEHVCKTEGTIFITRVQGTDGTYGIYFLGETPSQIRLVFDGIPYILLL